MNVSLHTAAPRIQFGNGTLARQAALKAERVTTFLNRDAVHQLQAEMHNISNPNRIHGQKPVNIGFDGVVREKSGAVYEGPSIRPSRPQVNAEEGTAPALAPFDA